MKRILTIFAVLVTVVALLAVSVGCQGSPGEQGLIGPQGPAGVTGVVGATGAVGPQGAEGDAGRPGKSIIWKGTATSAPTSWRVLNYAYYNSSQGKSYIWDGNSWELLAKDGTTGSIGPQGPQGPLGGTGVAGAPGADGADGTDGYTPIKGVDYFDGEPGLPGSDAECEGLQTQIDELESRIAALEPHPPLMEVISPLVLSTSTPDVLTGTVELVFDFSDAGNDLRDLMIDWCFEPYTQERKAQTNFLATEDMGIDPGVLAAMAEVGLVPSYDVGEQKWTLSINTSAVMTADIFATGIFGWVEAVGDPVFPDGRYDWYIEVRDWADNKWGNMMAPPAYSHYVCYFYSVPD